MTRNTTNKDNKKKETLTKPLHHPCSCFFCENNLDKQYFLYKGWGELKKMDFTKIDWNENPYKKGDMSISLAIQEKRREEVLQLAEKIEKILESDKDTYKKKVALFNLVKNLEVGEPQPLKEKRINHLLQTRLYNELAKKSIEEYKKTTMEAFSKREILREELLVPNNISPEELAKEIKVSKEIVKDIRRKRNPDIKPLQRTGRKRMMDRKDRYFLISYLSDKRANLQEMSDYLFEKVNKRISLSTIYLELKRINYSYQVIPYRHPKQKQNLAEVIEFMERVNNLPQHLILSTDESGHPLNLAQRKDLVKDTVNTEVFAKFLSRIELPSEGKYYLLLDNIRFHHSKKVKELLTNKNIEPKYIIASNPYLNPVEEVFNVIKQYVKKQRPRTEEELRKAISDKINDLQKEDLRKYFKDCLDFDFI
ncbi:313_t:CDS:2 [Cetraspora pellucida]|uniref:313_t:CDS:1 n=1 Tax=Cetraspora pellucida TaxID=1433469 RepID=A0ACA9LRQ7_9GLOM|nr:313_t:CDS:2 [Cetraspora pellucida]